MRAAVPSPPSPIGKHSQVHSSLLYTSPSSIAFAALAASRLFLKALGAIRTCIAYNKKTDKMYTTSNVVNPIITVATEQTFSIGFISIPENLAITQK